MKFSLIIASALVVSAAYGEEALKTDTKPINSFESESDLKGIVAKSGEVKPSETNATDGSRALSLKFNPPEAYPAVIFPMETPADFRGYGGLAFDVYNPGENTVAFYSRIDSDAKADGNGNHSRSGRGSIDGGQRMTFVIPFGVDPASLKMKALPGFGNFRSMGSLGSGPFDLGHIVSWQIFLSRPSESQEIIVDNVRLVPGRKQDFKGIIDKYGQYTREDWPGKVTKDEDFAAQRAEEDKILAAAKALPDRDKYGGWAAGPKLEATGFFRVEKYNGKWAFVDPEGHLFLSFGPTGVGPGGDSTGIKGREEMFATKLDEDPVLAKVKTGENGDGVDFFRANLMRKYGEDYKTTWYDRTYSRLQAWGFNTIAAFSSWDTLANGRVPYTATVWPGGKHAKVTWGRDHVRGLDDPFDPQFASDVAGAVKAQASRIKDDPYCIGYFVGNEEAWGHFKNDPAIHYGLVLGALKADAASSPAKRAMIEQLKQKYGDIAKLNEAWKTSFADWAALNAPYSPKTPLNEKMILDLSVFLELYAETYFRTVAEAIKAADPHHLYLGCRFAGYSPEVLKAAAKYNDVLSFNVYRLKLNPAEWGLLKEYDKPVVIGEFHFGATDRGVFDTGLIAATDQKARGASYDAYVKSVLDHPNFVGAHWFQYVDQPATGRTMDGENAGVGFVTITDTPHAEFIEAVRETNASIYPYRFSK